MKFWRNSIFLATFLSCSFPTEVWEGQPEGKVNEEISQLCFTIDAYEILFNIFLLYIGYIFFWIIDRFLY